MAQGFQADAGLGRHAKHLNEISDALRAAAKAARLVGIPADAYGRFCGSFPKLLRMVEHAGVTALDRSAAATESAATGIRATAAAYHGVDRGFVGRAGALE